MILIASLLLISSEMAPAADFDAVPRYQAAERLLQTETDPWIRADLVIRWFELKKKHVKPEEEQQLYDRLIEEDARLRAKAGDGGQKISRILAWHFFERKNFAESAHHFSRITNLNSREQLAFGDAYLNQGLLAMALAEYEQALKELEAPAAYRMGWAYLQFQDDQKALSFFDRALHAPRIEGLDVSAAAFRERVVPWMRLKATDSLTDADLKSLDELAKRIFTDSADQEILAMQEKLMDACLGKDFIHSAELVYQTMLKRDTSPQNFMLRSAPRWIRTYRARMNYDGVKKVLDGLPSGQLDETTHSDLRDEVFHTISAYEKILDTDMTQQGLKPHLTALYAQSFGWFPSSVRFEKSRVNEAKIHLDSGDAQRCVERLQLPSSEPSTEGARVLLLSRCRLHQLQGMISNQDHEAALKLTMDLLVREKAYERFPPGEADSVRDQLGRALLSVAEVSAQSELSFRSLEEMVSQSPWPENHPLKLEMLRAFENLKLRQIVAKGSDDSDKSSALLELAASSKVEDVKMTSLSNIVLMKSGQERVSSCKQISDLVARTPVDPSVEKVCLESLRDALEVDSLRAWLSVKSHRSLEQNVLLGISEMALGIEAGKQRLKDNDQQDLVKLFQVEPLGSAAQNVELDSFAMEATDAELKNPAGSLVKKMKAFEKIDGGLSNPFDRFLISDRFLKWMGHLSQNVKIDSNQRGQFDKQIGQLVGFWSAERERRRASHCQAFGQSHPFEENPMAECKDTFKESLEAHMKTWTSSVSSASSLTDVERESFRELIQIENPSKRMFKRLMILAGTGSSDLRALALQDWALETKRGDLLAVALSQNPQSSEFYQFKPQVMNAWYQNLYQMRLDHLEKLSAKSSQKSDSLN